MQSEKFLVLLRRLWEHISIKRRKEFVALVFLVVLSSFLEVISIGAIIPFLAVLTDPSQVYDSKYFQPLILLLGSKSPTDLIFPLTMIFMLISCITACIRLLLLWLTTRISFGTGAELSLAIYTSTLYQPYQVHISRNSSEVISGIVGKSNGMVSGIILPIVSLFSSALLTISIMITLFSIEPIVFTLFFLVFGLIYSGIIYFSRKKILEDGRIVSKEYTKIFKTLQEGLGGIRDILIDGTQRVFIQSYESSDAKIRDASSRRTFIGSSPKIVIEAIGIVGISFFSYTMSSNGRSFASLLPLLGSVALGASRLIPVIQTGYQSLISLKSSKEPLKDVLKLLAQEKPKIEQYEKIESLSFRRGIRLENLFFKYKEESNWILDSIDLDIEKGSRIGFIGSTGSGKSTIADILMALLKPTVGFLKVDDVNITQENVRAWQKNISHVPQSIFLADCSIAENIAFGLPKDEIDFEKIKDAAKQARLESYIESLDDRYQTIVGERGVRLSGGQRQRIGLARAFYKNSSVLILDEATSALDNETESEIMTEINNLAKDLTIIIIAHRLTTIKNCDRIIEIKNGKIERIGTYDTLFNK